VFTPIFKTHANNNPLCERKIWLFPEHYEYLRDAIVLRYVLSPYIYNAARQTYDNGICMSRPLYYYYPEEEKAYQWKEEFMFGDDILATAVCNPIDSVSGLAERKMWFPKGNDWYDMAHHKMHKGGSIETLYYAINENPWYPKAGSVIPLAAEGTMNLQQPTNAFRILVVPGAGRSSCTYYEDDANTQNYQKEYGVTTIEKVASGNTVTVKIGARKGDFKGSAATRRVGLVLEGVTSAPRSVTVDGKPLDASAVAVGSYSVSVQLPESNVTAIQTVVVKY